MAQQANVNRREFLKFVTAGSATALAGAVLRAAEPDSAPHTAPARAPASGPGRRPNFIIILADDLRYGDLGCYGNTDIPTPHIDSIAREGLRFTQAYVSAPVCSPSRAGLLTGRYQQRFGHENNMGFSAEALAKCGLPVQERTMADELKAAGYATGIVGKWHLGKAEQFRPQHRGFSASSWKAGTSTWTPPPIAGGCTATVSGPRSGSISPMPSPVRPWRTSSDTAPSRSCCTCPAAHRARRWRPPNAT